MAGLREVGAGQCGDAQVAQAMGAAGSTFAGGDRATSAEWVYRIAAAAAAVLLLATLI